MSPGHPPSPITDSSGQTASIRRRSARSSADERSLPQRYDGQRMPQKRLAQMFGISQARISPWLTVVRDGAEQGRPSRRVLRTIPRDPATPAPRNECQCSVPITTAAFARSSSSAQICGCTSISRGSLVARMNPGDGDFCHRQHKGARIIGLAPGSAEGGRPGASTFARLRLLLSIRLFGLIGGLRLLLLPGALLLRGDHRPGRFQKACDPWAWVRRPIFSSASVEAGGGCDGRAWKGSPETRPGYHGPESGSMCPIQVSALAR